MIIDKIRNASMYYGANPGLEKAFKFLLETDLNAIKPGRYELDGANVVALVQEYETKRVDEAEWEAHKSHLDVHWMVSGREKIGYAPIDGMRPIKDYNQADDYTILAPVEGDFVTVKEDRFVIVFPEDAHQPRVADGAPMPVKKICIKVSA